ncbi:hypothetical protein J7T55_000391 [Diaporthe amygdali]|uniref:uncharacterized protein n=1 Tax=Phomopsis amygdali TaxID=1214568 RepID=UPI0022FEB292|nr:uncharacterized protein J7T55_000391 [Diaporthe amygdali]KAJ0109466.1 hypothetical protein J7T55_000391 [Diaporthe amygdali]
MSPEDTSIPIRELTRSAAPSPPNAQVAFAESEPSSSTGGGDSRFTAAELALLKSAAGRLREHGSALRAEIESDPQMFVALERSASHRARCRAENDCLHDLAGNPCGSRIASEYRICVEGAKSWNHWAPTKHYYHTGCFARMMDLPPMIRDGNFRLREEPWGLMIRKWYENRGRVDLDKIQEYIEAHKAYKEVHTEYSTEWIEWQIKHGDSCNENERCECPPKPNPPEEPVLRDYKTAEGQVCGLSDLLRHENLEDMREEQWVTLGPDGRRVRLVRPEKEDDIE